MTGTLSRITAPAEPLLDVQDVRRHCRISELDEDAVLQDYIAAATDYLDGDKGILGEALVTQTWRLTMDAAPSGDVVLPLGPVQSISEIRYVDTSGASQLFSSANYRLVGSVVELVGSAAWPAVDDREAAFWIDFVAGYGAASAVKATIRQTARLLVADLYQNREATGDQSLAPSEAFLHMLAASRTARGIF